MSSSLKKEFLELLEKDVEFRYTVAGYLGLLEILKRLDKLEANQEKFWENQNKLWEEVRSLREDQNKLLRRVISLERSFKSFYEDFRELGRAVGMTLENYTA